MTEKFSGWQDGRRDIPQMPEVAIEPHKWPLIAFVGALAWFTVLGVWVAANYAIDRIWPTEVTEKAPDRPLEPWCYSLQQDMRVYDDRRREELSR